MHARDGAYLVARKGLFSISLIPSRRPDFCARLQRCVSTTTDDATSVNAIFESIPSTADDLTPNQS